jgi:hypothetical protein
MASFKFSSRQVGDPAAQLNFDQLEGTIDKLAPLPVSYANLAADAKNAFLKLAVGADRKIAFGQSNVTWPGAASISNQLTVTHGLGTTPLVVVATMQTNSQGQVIACHAGGYTATTFLLQAEWVGGFQPGAGGTIPAAWVAVG